MLRVLQITGWHRQLREGYGLYFVVEPHHVVTFVGKEDNLSPV